MYSMYHYIYYIHCFFINCISLSWLKKQYRRLGLRRRASDPDDQTVHRFFSSIIRMLLNHLESYMAIKEFGNASEINTIES